MNSMRLVFVNHCHPDTPHVCGVRVREFAKACAAVGHQVVLLTEFLPGASSDPAPDSLTDALIGHDWRSPFLLACRPIGGRLVARLREGRLVAPLHKPLVAACYLARGGLFTDWRDGSRPYWMPLARAFRPEAVWASFGNTDVWAIGQGIARLANCRWVMDIKDPWSVFVPGPLHGILADRFADCAGATALSAGHAQDAKGWFGRNAEVIYSGIDEFFLPPPPPAPRHSRQILVVGGLYAENHFAAMVEGLDRWARGGETVIYLGTESARFLEGTRRLSARARIEVPGFVGLDRLRALAAASAALLYVRNPRALYQHKLIELLSLNRPVLSLPGESAEAQAIAGELDARLMGCDDAAGLAAALERAVSADPIAVDRARLAAYTWAAQSRRLLAVLGGRA
jgi:glycosyltransferase involved in cell wall biosynthesis